MADENEEVVEQETVEDQRAPYVHPEGARDFRVEGNDIRDYIGVDPEYMTYANPADAPMLTDTERFLHTTQYDHLEGNADDEVEEAESENEEQVVDPEGNDDSSEEEPSKLNPPIL